MSSGLPKDVCARFAALRALNGSPPYIQQSDSLGILRQQLEEFYAYDEQNMPVLLGGITYLESLLELCADIISSAPVECKALIESFIHDFPGVPNSNLAGRWSALGEACIAFKNAGSAKSVHGLWDAAKSIHLNFNEFLSGLLPFLVIGLHRASGTTASTKIFRAVYADKLDVLDQLTGGLNGKASPLLALSHRAIRNAISHADIYFDQAAGLVRYGVKQQGLRLEETMHIHDFLLRAALYSHIPQAHLGAIAAAGLLMEGTTQDRARIRHALVHRRLP
ncbi:hypothetical protein HNQ07_004105 [Deinococcus metalli]|uniref:Uncharacterized protein n=1 Tax=Deinococcus metalli TaxID=1141878 RepID=A0A7W8KIW8_9DEIO|nr:hypothetical protein [Deinococcus metalli]MBB5378598.1 hypothetical protein [Deinococcus metalli]GHF61048.1 hypothetical protein GCM10017781_41470 [Deinococcus metalli]